MAKRPEIDTILTGSAEKHKLNKNFKAIAEKFDEMLSRDTTTDTPNFMETNLDVADANITNTTRLEVDVLRVQSTPFTGFSDEYVYLLAQLSCSSGAILTHDVDGNPVCLPPEDDGQVLKTVGTTVAWADDIDTDTIGVTVQEDGVTVAENVTTIDFKLAGKTLVTTPVSNQVDLALGELLGPLWEDTTDDNTNLNPDLNGSGFFDLVSETTRFDLTSVTTIPTADNQFYAVAETSAEITDSGGSDLFGLYGLGIRFYDDTGTSTPLTGNIISISLPEVGTIQDGNDSTATFWIFTGVPAGTKYIDFYWATQVGIPAAIAVANLTNRYRGLIRGAARDTHLTPLGNGWQNGKADYP